MKNFYYVLSFNLINQKVKDYLKSVKFTATVDSMVDFKIRSKLFLSFNEAVSHVHDDFNLKLSSTFTDGGSHKIRIISLLNPVYAMGVNSEMMSQIIERFGENAINDWSEDCCGTVFFLTDSETEEDSDEYHHSDWMFKYEVYITEDPIELGANGDYAFASRNFTSTYH